MELAKAGEGSRALREIASKLISMAAGGDLQAMKEIADRIEGKVPQAQIVSGDDDGGPMRLVAIVPAKAESTEAWLEACAPRLQDKVIDAIAGDDVDP
jgi:hypothetical protein